jgi:hypothetical protein
MNIGKVALLALVAAGLGAYQYQKDLRAAQGEKSAAEQTLKEANEALQLSKAKTAEISQQLVELAKEEKGARAALEGEVAALQKSRSDLAQEFALAVQKVREATVGMRWPTLALADGRTLLEPVVRNVSESSVELAHSAGSEQVPGNKLPQELQERLRLGPAAQAPSVAGDGTAPGGLTVVGLQSSIRQLEQTREKLYRSKGEYTRQAIDYRNKDAHNRMAGKPLLYTRIIPKVEASVVDVSKRISEVNVEISNLEMQLATIKAGAQARS